MKARDYRLVVNGKYNRVAIMQRAWAIVRTNKRVGIVYTISEAIHQAWNDAKVDMDNYKISQKSDEIKPHRVLPLGICGTNNYTLGYCGR